MNNRNRLFTRLDAQNNKIPGSSVERLKMPRTGKWVEEAVNICCFPYTELSYEPVSVESTIFTFIISCDGSNFMTIDVTSGEAIDTIEGVVELLNSQLSFLGSFTVEGSEIVAKFKNEVLTPFACAGTLSFEVEPD